jgi:hydrogenase maturation protein HypF
VPPASSCGRLFDAVAAALGLCADHALFEGQGAMELEALAERWSDAEPYSFAITEQNGGLLHLESFPMWYALLEDLGRKTPHGRIAARFHRGLAKAIRDTVAHIRSTNTSLNTGSVNWRLFSEQTLVGRSRAVIQGRWSELSLTRQSPNQRRRAGVGTGCYRGSPPYRAFESIS